MELQQWSYSQKIWLLNYSAQLKIVGHCSSKVKIYIYYFILCSHWWLEYFFFFLLLPHFYPLLLSPLSQSSHSSFLPIASFNSSTRHRPKPLLRANLSPYLTPIMPISSFSAPISLLSHFSYTLSLNLSPSQTPRPMIVDSGFWFCHHDRQNNVVAVTRFLQFA